jgi:hypothetical protein
MESVIFDYIGYVLVFCAALCVAAPLVVYLIDFIVGVIWEVVDEGDSESPNIPKKVMPFLFSDGVTEWGSKWVVEHKGGYTGSAYGRSGRDWWQVSEYIEKHCTLDSKEDAEELSKKIGVCYFNFVAISVSFCSLSIAGAGLILIPTITMYLLSSALCLLSLRWSRRGYKKVKSLKAALDNHAKDKEAHK